MAMRKSIHDGVDVQSLVPRHQLRILHCWILSRVTALAVLQNAHTALSIRHAALSNYRQFVVVSNQYAVLCHYHAALSN